MQKKTSVMKKTFAHLVLAQQNEELAVRNLELEQRLAALQQELAERQQAETRLRRQQEELRASDAKLRALADHLPALISYVDRDGYYRYVNASYEKSFGLQSQQIVGRQVQEILGVAYPRVAPYLQRALAGECVTFEFEMDFAQGAKVMFAHYVPDVDAQGEVQGVHIQVNDITQRKRSEEKLRESEMRFRMLADNMSQFAWMADERGWVFWYNQRWFDYTGTTLEDMQGWGWQTVHHPDHVDRVTRRIQQAWDTGEEWEDTFPLRGRNGEYRWFLSRAVPIRDESGKLIRWFGTNTDITAERISQQERETLLQREKRAHNEAEAANRAKDEFLAMVSHELRAPLNAMLGWAKILRGGKYKPETLSHALEVIERSARSQQQLIEDLLDSSRIISGKLRLEMQPVDMAMLIETAVDTMRPAAAAKNITIETCFLGEIDVITGDSERLQQIVWNLISNAVKFTPAGGHIRLQLERVDPYLQLIVSDTGKGIADDFLPHVFDRFHQADSSTTRRYSGLGLGLALVRHLVELHGGTIRVESPGEELGTSFTINLPLRAVRPLADESASATERHSLPKSESRVLAGLQILVVDDGADARDLITMMLQEQGAQVVAVSSAEEALAALTQTDKTPFACLVSDIGMPGKNGYELMRYVRALPPQQGGKLPAVALTAYGRAKDRIAALSAGFQMHVPKPVEPAELVMVIAGLTGRVGKGMSA